MARIAIVVVSFVALAIGASLTLPTLDGAEILLRINSASGQLAGSLLPFGTGAANISAGDHTHAEFSVAAHGHGYAATLHDHGSTYRMNPAGVQYHIIEPNEFRAPEGETLIIGGGPGGARSFALSFGGFAGPERFAYAALHLPDGALVESIDCTVSDDGSPSPTSIFTSIRGRVEQHELTGDPPATVTVGELYNDAIADLSGLGPTNFSQSFPPMAIDNSTYRYVFKAGVYVDGAGPDGSLQRVYYCRVGYQFP